MIVYYSVVWMSEFNFVQYPVVGHGGCFSTGLSCGSGKKFTRSPRLGMYVRSSDRGLHLLEAAVFVKIFAALLYVNIYILACMLP